MPLAVDVLVAAAETADTAAAAVAAAATATASVGAGPASASANSFRGTLSRAGQCEAEDVPSPELESPAQALAARPVAAERDGWLPSIPALSGEFVRGCLEGG